MGFQWTARIRSVISWAEPEMSSESAKAASTPSVASIRTSPGRTVERRGSHDLAARARDAAPERELALRPRADGSPLTRAPPRCPRRARSPCA